MSDLKKSARELGAKAAFDAARDTAKRALDDAMATEEERAARKAREDARTKRRRTQRLVLVLLGLLIVLGLIGLALRYWYWLLLLGLLGIAALYGRHRWRKRRAARRERMPEPSARLGPSRKEPSALPEPRRARDEPEQPAGSSVEDELAALKARLDK
jgi:Flp pilus assembly protein TadB